MTIISLSTLSLTERTTLWNAAFSDYIVPLYYSESELTNRITSLKLSTTDSKVINVNNQGAGIMLFGTQAFKEKKQSWIGGIGIHPNFRRQGLALKLMTAAINQARENACDDLLLEVIIGNDRAETIYRELGFKDVSHVLVAKRNLSTELVNHHSIVLKTVNITSAHIAAESPITTWQNRLNTAGTLKDIYIGDKKIGSLFFSENQKEQILDSLTLKQFICDIPPTIEIIESLLAALTENYGSITCSFSNFSLTETYTSMFMDLGFEEQLQQFQLSLSL